MCATPFTGTHVPLMRNFTENVVYSFTVSLEKLGIRYVTLQEFWKTPCISVRKSRKTCRIILEYAMTEECYFKDAKVHFSSGAGLEVLKMPKSSWVDLRIFKKIARCP